jgi:ABC-2 type transport system ATP-binding protein
METIISVKGLRKIFKVGVRQNQGCPGAFKPAHISRFKIINVIEDFNLRIHRPEIHALVGPAGAGKSTIIKILSGMLYPTQGYINVMGFIPWKEQKQYEEKIGVVLGKKSRLIWALPALDTFALHRHIFKLSNMCYRENLAYLVKNLDIGQAVKKPVRTLTPGERIRCEIVCALLHNPQLLFLDEPATCVDKDAGNTIKSFIKKLNRDRNVTVIITTRDLAEIKDLCDTLSVIYHGKIIYNDSVDNLKMYHSKANMIEIIISQSLAEPYASKCKLEQVNTNTGNSAAILKHIYQQNQYN